MIYRSLQNIFRFTFNQVVYKNVLQTSSKHCCSIYGFSTNRFLSNIKLQSLWLENSSSLKNINYIQQRFSSKNINSNIEKSEINDTIVNHELDDIQENDYLYKSIQIEARCADQQVLDSYKKFVTMTAYHLNIELSRTWEPWRTIKRRTLLRSAFVKKKYRVQYEWRTYYRSMEFRHLTGSTADTFLEYIERNLPESVALKVTRKRLETIPSHLVPQKNEFQN